MTKRLLALAIAAVVLNLVCVSFVGAQQANNDDKHIRKIKKQVAHKKRWNPEDPILVKFNDGTTAKGYIAEVLDDRFVVTDRNGQQPVSVNYAEVKNIKSGGLGGNLKTNFAGAVGGGALAILVICLISKSCSK